MNHASMTWEEYEKAIRARHNIMLDLMMRKSHDYSGHDNVFGNFQLMECINDHKFNTVDGMLYRIGDKFSRISNLLGDNNTPLVLDENLHQTIIDMANYLVILDIYLSSMEENTPRTKQAVQRISNTI